MALVMALVMAGYEWGSACQWAFQIRLSKGNRETGRSGRHHYCNNVNTRSSDGFEARVAVVHTIVVYTTACIPSLGYYILRWPTVVVL